MWLLWLTMQQAVPTPVPSLPFWRVVSSRRMNLGVRPAMFVTPGERAAGVTVQVRLSLP